MRIGLNLLYLLPGRVGGTQTYAEELVRALTGLDDDTEYVAFVNRESASLDLDGGDRLRLHKCDIPATNRLRRYAYEQIVLPRTVGAMRMDVMHSLGYVGPVCPPCPHVLTVHDVIYRGFAEHLSTVRRLTLRTAVRGAARRAAVVLTDSAASRDDLLDDLPVLAPARVRVVPLAPRSDWDWSAGPPELPERLLAMGVRRPYVLGLGSLSPSKNLPRLVAAVALLGRPDVQLVLAGHLPTDGVVEAAVAAERMSDSVVITGYLTSEELQALTGAAAVLAFPSTYEGFGLPVLDAQAAGVPVVCSTAASLPEVAGGGALLVDPASTGELSAALARTLDDESLRSELIAAGHHNVAGYSWRRTADLTLAAYRAAAETGSSR